MNAARISIAILIPLVSFLTSKHATADQAVEHGFGGDPTISATVDDDGGFTGEFKFIFDSTPQMGEGNLILWDATNSQNYDGNTDNDFAGTGAGMRLIDPAANLGDTDEHTPGTNFSAGPFRANQWTYVVDDGSRHVLRQQGNTGNLPDWRHGFRFRYAAI